jgi:hypothetical protein
VTEKNVVMLDASNGEVTERPMTSEEISSLEKTLQADLIRKETNEAVKASALAKLAALGLTEAEIAAL